MAIRIYGLIFGHANLIRESPIVSAGTNEVSHQILKNRAYAVMTHVMPIVGININTTILLESLRHIKDCMAARLLSTNMSKHIP